MFAGICVLLIAPLIVGLNEHLEDSQSLCPSMYFFHFRCPGCGMTKAMVSLYRGDILESLRYNPLGIVIITFCVILLFAIGYDRIRRSDTFDRIVENRYLWQSITFCYVVYYITTLFIAE